MNLSIRLTACLGLLAAILVGTGEFLLHYDPLARFGDGYAYMADISDARLTAGHFFAMIGIPLYFVGCWHIYQMLKPGGNTLAFVAFLIGSYGFMMGAVWMGSRASIASIQHFPDVVANTNLQQLYELRYETLLQGVRLGVLAMSGITAYMIFTRKTRFPRWMAITNPFVLILCSFLVFAIVPSIGKYVMPIAMNVAFGIFYSLSLMFGDMSSPEANFRPASGPEAHADSALKTSRT